MLRSRKFLPLLAIIFITALLFQNCYRSQSSNFSLKGDSPQGDSPSLLSAGSGGDGGGNGEPYSGKIIATYYQIEPGHTCKNSKGENEPSFKAALSLFEDGTAQFKKDACTEEPQIIQNYALSSDSNLIMANFRLMVALPGIANPTQLSKMVPEVFCDFVSEDSNGIKTHLHTQVFKSYFLRRIEVFKMLIDRHGNVLERTELLKSEAQLYDNESIKTWTAPGFTQEVQFSKDPRVPGIGKLSFTDGGIPVLVQATCPIPPGLK